MFIYGASWRHVSLALIGPYWRRSVCSYHGSGAARGRSAVDGRQPIIFLGTPQVAALVLGELLKAAEVPNSLFKVAAVVSRPSGKHWQVRQQGGLDAAVAADPKNDLADAMKASPSEGPRSAVRPAPNWSRHGASAVERLACSCGIPSELILCPISAREPSFLDAIRRLRPALAVTAAYGAILPQAFLDIPKYGTINIHPSLLPKYRGAAPVQRALQDGCSETGVSLVFTVIKCDAGPVLEQQQVPIPPDIQAPELTEQLFRLGAAMLLRRLPQILQGEVSAESATLQDENEATYAPKIVKQESYLDFRRSARACHDQVRALAGWPGSRASLLLEDKATGTRDPLELKIVRTQVKTAPATLPGHGACAASHLPPGASAQVLCDPAGELLIPCGDGNMLSVLEVGRRPGSGSPPTPSTSLNSSPSIAATPGAAAPSPKGLTAKEFIAGLGKRRMFLPSRM